MQKINFNDRYGLTDAVIEGRKIMTRRVVPWDLTERWMEFVSDAPSVGGVYVHESEKDFYEREAPRYKVGEVVAVAQRYSTIAAGHPDVDTFLLQVAKAHKISIESVQDLAGWDKTRCSAKQSLCRTESASPESVASCCGIFRTLVA